MQSSAQPPRPQHHLSHDDAAQQRRRQQRPQRHGGSYRRQLADTTAEFQTYLESSVRSLFERFDLQRQVSDQQLWRSRREEDRPQLERKRDRLAATLGDIVALFRTAIFAIMNAAVAIFGVGVGVGLILGDSFRQSPMRTADDVAQDLLSRPFDQSEEDAGRQGGVGDRSEPRSGLPFNSVGHQILLEAPSLSNLPAQ